MTRRTTLSILFAAVLVLGGVFWYLDRAGTATLDAAGQALLARTATQRGSDELDRDSCRELLAEIGRHPQASVDAELVRARAWLQLQLSRTQQALQTIEARLGVDAAPADQILGARILARRHAETGKIEMAHRAALLAEEHYLAKSEVASIFLAWQMAVHKEDAELCARLVDLLRTHHAETAEGRLVAQLAGYPDEVKAQRAELTALESEFVSPPPELDLALAWLDIGGDEAAIDVGLDRIERVLRDCPSSITARTLGAIAASRRKQWVRARAFLAWLLGQHPKHRRAPMWRKLLEVVDAGQARPK